jgi:hypothetical protein
MPGVAAPIKVMSWTTNTPRQPRGIPIGGEFANHSRTESQIGLNPELRGFHGEERTKRAAALIHGGFVPVTSTEYLPSRTAAGWWNAAYARAEHRPRRLRRSSYRGGGVSLTMPSVNQIRKHSAKIGHETFDIPVSGNFPGGSVQGWVRVTRNKPGVWSVSGPGMTKEAQAYVGEAVSALLESRRISTAMTEETDLIARRRQRFARGGVAMSKTEKSGFISGVGYNDAAQTMAVKIGKRHYSYSVSKDVFAQVRAARSPGQAYNILVKGTARSEAVTSCDNCGRFSTVSAGHRCPSSHRPMTAGAKPGNTEARIRARGVAG